VLKLVYSANLRFAGVSRERSTRSLDIRGYSLNGKTPILQVVILGSSPDNSNTIYCIYIVARKAQLVERKTEDF
jgi:hypothetical protein